MICKAQRKDIKKMKKNRVMIVDDEPDNLNILESMLRQEGYEISAFPRGDLALNSALNNPPDIVLLDIRMPGMDGYTLCEHFKNNQLLKDIPIIFLSALADTNDKVHAFNVGGVDYVTKPFSEHEVMSRVKTHIQLRHYQLYLEELVRKRTENLTEAHRRLKIWDDAKDQWLSLLAHEIKTPLNGIFGSMQLIIEKTSDDLSDLKNIYNDSMQRLVKLVDDALLLIKIKVDSTNYTSELTQINVTHLLGDMLTSIRSTTDVHIEFKQRYDMLVLGQQHLLYQAFQDLLQTVIKCLKPGHHIDINIKKTNHQQFLYIWANGHRLKDNDIESFFYPFGQRTLYRGSGDFGLRPALAKSIIKLFKGSVSVKNQDNDNGFVIEICFPIIDRI
jgi:DNA-binding response OmpR family regulator